MMPPEQQDYLDQVRAWLSAVTYKPDTEFRLFTRWDNEPSPRLSIVRRLADSLGPHAQDLDVYQDTASHVMISQQLLVPHYLDRDGFLQWLFGETRRMEMHEHAEWFKVDGKPLHDPHPHLGEEVGRGQFG